MKLTQAIKEMKKGHYIQVSNTSRRYKLTTQDRVYVSTLHHSAWEYFGTLQYLEWYDCGHDYSCDKQFKIRRSNGNDTRTEKSCRRLRK
jgi:hypothetical protein